MKAKVAELVERVRLTEEEIKETGVPVLKEMAKTFRVLGKRFIDNDITYEEYKSLSNELSNEYELLYERAIAEAQLNKVLNDKDLYMIDRDKSLFTVMLDANNNAYYPATPLAEAIKEG